MEGQREVTLKPTDDKSSSTFSDNTVWHASGIKCYDSTVKKGGTVAVCEMAMHENKKGDDTMVAR